MNALLELLASDADMGASDVRAATTETLQGLKGDSRLTPYRDQQDLYGLCAELVQLNDHRLLDLRTNPITELTWNFEIGVQQRPQGRYIFNVTDPTVLDDPSGPEYQSLVRNTTEVRLGALPFRAQIYGRRSALLPLDFDDNMVGAYVTTEPGLIQGLLQLHRRIWLGANSDIDHLIPAPRQEVAWTPLFRQLVSGRTDEAAARATGMSLRTYRRRVQTLMTDLGVQSRFAAGVEAQRRGLLELVA